MAFLTSSARGSETTQSVASPTYGSSTGITQSSSPTHASPTEITQSSSPTHGSSTEITQYVVGPNACGPTAILYAFKRGGDSLRAAYEKLEGTDDQQKLKSIVQKFGALPSLTTYHKTRLEPIAGMAPDDIYATASDLLERARSVVLKRLARHRSENQPETFLKRIHSEFKKSLEEKVPLITIAVPYAQRENKWRELVGHYIVVTDVSEISKESFSITYLDPSTGREHSASLTEEAASSLPYLQVNAPDLKLKPRDLPAQERFVVTLALAIGSFGSENQSALPQRPRKSLLAFGRGPVHSQPQAIR